MNCQLSALLMYIKSTLGATLGDGGRGRRLSALYNKTRAAASFTSHDELPPQTSLGETECSIDPPLNSPCSRVCKGPEVLWGGEGAPVGALPVCSLPSNAMC